MAASASSMASHCAGHPEPALATVAQAKERDFLRGIGSIYSRVLNPASTFASLKRSSSMSASMRRMTPWRYAPARPFPSTGQARRTISVWLTMIGYGATVPRTSRRRSPPTGTPWRVRTREAFPVDWASTQSRLGIAYGDRLRGHDLDNMRLAVAAFQAALRLHTGSVLSRMGRSPHRSRRYFWRPQ